MTMEAPPTDSPVGARPRGLRTWLPLGMVALVISLVYVAGLNRNALYLSLLGLGRPWP